jgi:AraC-like DNA-binding protein
MYAQYQPAPVLRQLVRCYWSFTDSSPALQTEGEEGEVERIVPDGCPELLFHFGTPHAGQRDAAPQVVIVGQLSAPLLLKRQGPVDVVGIRFSASGARRLGLPPMQELTDARVDCSALGTPPLWHALARALGTAQSLEGAARIAVLEKCLLGLLAEVATQAPDLVDLCVQEIERSGGQVRIELVAKGFCISVRQLERRFLAAVGVTPKAYCRIVRFERACKEAKRLAWGGWSQVAADCGYFDQPHLVLDFQHFTGQSPREFADALTPLNAAILHHD